MRRLALMVLAALIAFGGVLAVPVAAVGAAEDDDGAAGSGVSVTRYGGADRYETSLQVAEAVAADADGSLEWVVLVSGRRWTDAVVAAPVAGALGAPVLMTPPGELHAGVAAYLGEAADGEPDGSEPSTAPGVLPAGTCGGAIDDEPSQLVPSANAEDPAWSPDCSRLIYTENGNWRAHIWTVNVDGSHNNQRTEGDVIDRWATWSPDGQRIAFHTIDTDGKHRTYVAGASGEPAGIGDDCRPNGIGHTTAGFPLPRWAPPAVGTVRIGVLFMDFPDAQAAHTTEEEAALGLPWAEEYLEAASYGRLDVEFVPLHRWLRAEQEFAEYIGPTAIENSEALVTGASAHAVALADDEVDFSTLDMVLTVFPGSHFSGGNATGEATADDVTVTTTRVHTSPLEEPREPDEWGSLGAHEIAHNLGLLDMYPYDFERHTLPELSGDNVWAFVDMGLMGLRAQFRTQSSDQRLQHVWRFPDGNTQLGTAAHFELEEMLGWSRWQLGWLDPSQVHCDSGAGATVSLAPIAEAGDSGSSEVDDFPVLGLGESVTLHGYTVTVTADNGSTHTVAITRNN